MRNLICAFLFSGFGGSVYGGDLIASFDVGNDFFEGELKNDGGQVFDPQLGVWPRVQFGAAQPEATVEGVTFRFNTNGVPVGTWTERGSLFDGLRKDYFLLNGGIRTSPVQWELSGLRSGGQYSLIVYSSSANAGAQLSVVGHDGGNGVGQPVGRDADGDSNFQGVVADGTGKITGFFDLKVGVANQWVAFAGLQVSEDLVDEDGDGMSDFFELDHTTPPSRTGLLPGDDLENGGMGDGLTNLQEFQNRTDPMNSDTDGDGLSDGEEVAGAGMRPPTNPAKVDTDGDGLSDLVETRTGVWVGASDFGTDPTEVDTDGDGFRDNLENGSRVFVNLENPGTDPTKGDTDGDGAGDWFEVVGLGRNPNLNEGAVRVPYPLPVSDGSGGVSTKPVKVYIMSGQSNMVGYGRVTGTGVGTLESLVRENKFSYLADENGEWIPRNDVIYRGLITALAGEVPQPLKPGFGRNAISIGPELGFGQVMGWYHDEPVLLLKAAQGSRSLVWDFATPGAQRFDFEGMTYAGFGDQRTSWAIGTEPVPQGWYAGRQFDESFRDESEWVPDTGFNNPVTNVVDILDNFGTEFPQWADQGFEIAGYVWWQGHKDQTAAYSSVYESYLVRFIKELRAYYEGRYPEQTSPNAPFTIATIGFEGVPEGTFTEAVFEAQLNVSGEKGGYPEFEGNVKTVDIRDYWREEGPSGEIAHYQWNAETYYLVGDSLGRAMVDLLEGEVVVTGGFDDYMSAFPGVGGEVGADDDPDGDGIANAIEAWMGTNPAVKNDGWVIEMEGENGLKASHQVNPSKLPDLVGGYEWSSDLESWFAADGVAGNLDGVTVSVNVTNPVAGQAEISATPSRAVEKLYLRLKVRKE